MKNMYELDKEQMNDVYEYVRLHKAMDSIRESLEYGDVVDIDEQTLKEATEKYLIKLDHSDTAEFIKEEILRGYFDWGV